MNICSLEQWERDSRYVDELRQRVAELEATLREAKETIEWMNVCTAPAQDEVDKAIATIKKVLGEE